MYTTIINKPQKVSTGPELSFNNQVGFEPYYNDKEQIMAKYAQRNHDNSSEASLQFGKKKIVIDAFEDSRNPNDSEERTQDRQPEVFFGKKTVQEQPILNDLFKSKTQENGLKNQKTNLKNDINPGLFEQFYQNGLDDSSQNDSDCQPLIEFLPKKIQSDIMESGRSKQEESLAKPLPKNPSLEESLDSESNSFRQKQSKPEDSNGKIDSMRHEKNKVKSRKFDLFDFKK